MDLDFEKPHETYAWRKQIRSMLHLWSGLYNIISLKAPKTLQQHSRRTRSKKGRQSKEVWSVWKSFEQHFQTEKAHENCAQKMITIIAGNVETILKFSSPSWSQSCKWSLDTENNKNWKSICFRCDQHLDYLHCLRQNMSEQAIALKYLNPPMLWFPLSFHCPSWKCCYYQSPGILQMNWKSFRRAELVWGGGRIVFNDLLNPISTVTIIITWSYHHHYTCSVIIDCIVFNDPLTACFNLIFNIINIGLNLIIVT